MNVTTQTVAWPVFEAPLVSRELVAEQTMSFRWAKPADWTYRAGQFIDITRHNPPETDAEGDLRGFSISSAPCEEIIQITTRLRDTAFKRVLQQLPLGTSMKLEGPFGDLRLHHAQRPAVLLAGGIGITPFRSILVEQIRAGSLPYPVVLFHANHRPENAPFADELRELAEAAPQLTFVPTMTSLGPGDTSWDGERGRFDSAMLERHLAGITNPIYYIAGPAGMLQGTQAMLVAAGIDEDDIRTEAFTGY
jgi:ferredoxin-NADP reductase